ncbi:MAG: hypothetical protein DSZ33_03410, partial [Gammaproteobacteria bacterium]
MMLNWDDPLGNTSKITADSQPPAAPAAPAEPVEDETIDFLIDLDIQSAEPAAAEAVAPAASPLSGFAQ